MSREISVATPHFFTSPQRQCIFKASILNSPPGPLSKIREGERAVSVCVIRSISRAGWVQAGGCEASWFFSSSVICYLSFWPNRWWFFMHGICVDSCYLTACQLSGLVFWGVASHIENNSQQFRFLPWRAWRFFFIFFMAWFNVVKYFFNNFYWIISLFRSSDVVMW